MFDSVGDKQHPEGKGWTVMKCRDEQQNQLEKMKMDITNEGVIDVKTKEIIIAMDEIRATYPGECVPGGHLKRGHFHYQEMESLYFLILQNDNNHKFKCQSHLEREQLVLKLLFYLNVNNENHQKNIKAQTEIGRLQAKLMVAETQIETLKKNQLKEGELKLLFDIFQEVERIREQEKRDEFEIQEFQVKVTSKNTQKSTWKILPVIARVILFLPFFVAVDYMLFELNWSKVNASPLLAQLEFLNALEAEPLEELQSTWEDAPAFWEWDLALPTKAKLFNTWSDVQFTWNLEGMDITSISERINAFLTWFSEQPLAAAEDTEVDPKEQNVVLDPEQTL